MFVSGNFFAHKTSNHNGAPGLKNENKNRRETAKINDFPPEMCCVDKKDADPQSLCRNGSRS